jgi:hypothetical protein
MVGVRMPYRFLCNDVQREGIKSSPDLASELFCYVVLHNIWYGILRTRFQAVENIEVTYPDRIFQLKSEHA